MNNAGQDPTLMELMFKEKEMAITINIISKLYSMLQNEKCYKNNVEEVRTVNAGG